MENIHKVITKNDILEFQNIVKQIHAEEAVLKYITRIVTQTRNFTSLYLGASPRASYWILQAAKASAAMQGRDFITPDDVQRMAYPVLRHRLMLTPDKEMEGITTNDTIKQILEKKDDLFEINKVIEHKWLFFEKNCLNLREKIISKSLASV